MKQSKKWVYIYNSRNGSYGVVHIAESIVYPMWVICERFYNIHCGKEVCGNLCGVETDVECVWKVIVDWSPGIEAFVLLN